MIMPVKSLRTMLSFAGVLLAVAVSNAWSQWVAIDARPLYGNYIVGEPATVNLLIENHGAQPLVIDEHPAFAGNQIEFDLRHDPMVRLPKTREGQIVPELNLMHNEAYSNRINLSSWYPLLREGRYRVSAALRHNDRLYSSRQRVFDVVPGIELARGTTARDEGPGTRHFQLVYWARQGRELLFLRTSDQPEDVVWLTLELGPIVRIATPRMEIESPRQLTVIHQATKDAFVSSRIRMGPNGPELAAQDQVVADNATPFVRAMMKAAAEERQNKRGRKPTRRQRP